MVYKIVVQRGRNYLFESRTLMLMAGRIIAIINLEKALLKW